MEIARKIEFDQGFLSILSIVLVGFFHSFDYAGILLVVMTLFRIFETCRSFDAKVVVVETVKEEIVVEEVAEEIIDEQPNEKNLFVSDQDLKD